MSGRPYATHLEALPTARWRPARRLAPPGVWLDGLQYEIDVDGRSVLLAGPYLIYDQRELIWAVL
jgi:hypothetical protein